MPSPAPASDSVPGLFKATGRLGFGLRAKDAVLKRDVRVLLAQVVAKGIYGRLLSDYHIPEDTSPFHCEGESPQTRRPSTHFQGPA